MATMLGCSRVSALRASRRNRWSSVELRARRPDQDLQCDLVAGLGMDGPIDRAHPAASQRFEDAVAPDPQVGHGVAQETQLAN